MKNAVVVGLNAVIVAVTDETPRVLTIEHPVSYLHQPGDSAGGYRGTTLSGLPFGPLDPEGDRTLELALRGWVRHQSGIELGYVEQLYTFADQDRDPRFSIDRSRVISVAYLALVREVPPRGTEARWQDWYSFLPWEDWREGRPGIIDNPILPALNNWLNRAGSKVEQGHRRERIDLAFGCSGVAWNWERALDRYELLYEVGLVGEAARDRLLQSTGGPLDPNKSSSVLSKLRDPHLGLSMILDHRRILATALDRVRGKLKYRPVVFELLPPSFTLFQLQRLVESLAGLHLHKQNFRRLVERAGLVEKTGKQFLETGGRPAELFRFRREVLRERPAPGIGLPVVH